LWIIFVSLIYLLFLWNIFVDHFVSLILMEHICECNFCWYFLFVPFLDWLWVSFLFIFFESLIFVFFFFASFNFLVSFLWIIFVSLIFVDLWKLCLVHFVDFLRSFLCIMFVTYLFEDFFKNLFVSLIFVRFTKKVHKNNPQKCFTKTTICFLNFKIIENFNISITHLCPTFGLVSTLKHI